jgi:hypothetical protein
MHDFLSENNIVWWALRLVVTLNIGRFHQLNHSPISKQITRAFIACIQIEIGSWPGRYRANAVKEHRINASTAEP